MSSTYGYAAGTAGSEKWKEQRAAIRKFGVPENHIIMEEAGRGEDRPRFHELVGRLRSGDVLVVESLDGLGRNYTEIFDCWNTLSKDRAVEIVVLDMPMMNTYTPGDIMRPAIADVMLQAFIYITGYQRRSAHEWQAECIDAAKDRGVQFGRPRVDLPADFMDTVRLWRAGEITSTEAARRLKISRSTFFRRLNDLGLGQSRGAGPASRIRRGSEQSDRKGISGHSA